MSDPTPPAIPDWLANVPQYDLWSTGMSPAPAGEWVRLADVVAAAQPIHRALIQVIQERDKANEEAERHERGRQTLTEEVDRLMQEKEDLRAERDEWIARFNKLPEIVERAEDRARLRTEHQQPDLTALRAAYELFTNQGPAYEWSLLNEVRALCQER
jgi:chromosome segregation ATPase